MNIYYLVLINCEPTCGRPTRLCAFATLTNSSNDLIFRLFSVIDCSWARSIITAEIVVMSPRMCCSRNAPTRLLSLLVTSEGDALSARNLKAR